jgi:phage protein D
MIRELLTVQINGRSHDDLRADITEVEVEEDVEAADVFRVRLSVRGNGVWRYLDDDRLALWNRLVIRIGYPDNQDDLIDGYITHHDIALSGSGAQDSFLELSGMDTSAVMDLEDKQRAWPNKRDSDIAQDIFAAYGLSWEIEDTELVHDEPRATIVQSESDIRFLQRLAARNGFECFVKSGRGFFRTADLEQPPQKLLQFAGASPQAGASNLIGLHIAVDGTPPTVLAIRRIDPFEKHDDHEVLRELPERPLGSRTLAALRAGVRTGSRLLRRQPAVSAQELRARLRAAYQPASGFVVASGEVDGRSYSAVLRAKRRVTIKSASSAHSGAYYVTRVRHLLTADAYVQGFEARRNAIDVLGTESFTAPPARTPITPSRGAEPAAGNRLLPPQRGQTGSLTGGA